jgi:alkanesulfonate monooxygenase SsuD/methylene tetrahydromethanopterin reductase-like flavin-dependent oxidoreductase (luciferase family)
MSANFEIGLFTTGELHPNPHTGTALSSSQRLQEIVAAGQMADEAGLDVFAVGENHEPDFSLSAHTVVLGALAASTKNIRLASATTGIGTADPVRIFQEFATIDSISGGRAEIIAGRGARGGAFQLFGHSMDDYNELFAEKIDLLLQLVSKERISWSGQFRPPIRNTLILPRPVQQPIPVWMGSLGSARSAEQAGALGMPLTVAILGGSYDSLTSTVNLYRQSAAASGYRSSELRVAITDFLYIDKDSQSAISMGHPYYSSAIKHFFGRDVSRREFEQAVDLHRAPMAGIPQQIIEQMLYQHELFGHQRILCQIDSGGIELSKIEKMIDLLATEVAPVVKKEIARRTSKTSKNTLRAGKS